MAQTPIQRREVQTVGEYLQGLAAALALEKRIASRAAQLERELSSDLKRLREAMRAETDSFRLRRLEAAYLYCVQRLAAMRRARALARHSSGELERLLPSDVRRRL